MHIFKCVILHTKYNLKKYILLSAEFSVLPEVALTVQTRSSSGPYIVPVQYVTTPGTPEAFHFHFLLEISGLTFSYLIPTEFISMHMRRSNLL